MNLFKKIIRFFISIDNTSEKSIVKIFGIKITLSKRIKKSQLFDIFCINFCGGDFKKYILENNMPVIIAKLKNGLDENSLRVVDRKISDFLNWPNYNENLNIKGIGYESYLTESEINEQKSWLNVELKELLKKYKFCTKNHICQEVFKNHHGLKDAPKEVIEYIKNKDFLDVGAYIGDSSIILQEYNPRKIYVFEGPALQKIVKENMALNNISSDKYELFDYLLGVENKEINVNSNTGNISIYDEGSLKVKMVTLDTFINSIPNIDFKLLKMDIEGAEFDVIKSGIASIKKHRPVICCAIYHNPYQFFELKTYLEENLDNYKFEIKNLTTCEIHRETMIFAYPKEIFVNNSIY